jgi:hypothetical protein
LRIINKYLLARSAKLDSPEHIRMSVRDSLSLTRDGLSLTDMKLIHCPGDAPKEVFMPWAVIDGFA